MLGASILRAAKELGTVELVSIYLLPECVGRGLGHFFYRAIEDAIKARGYTRCVLDVLAENKRAVRFYEGHGFTATGEVIYAKLGKEEYPCNIMAKEM